MILKNIYTKRSISTDFAYALGKHTHARFSEKSPLQFNIAQWIRIYVWFLIDCFSNEEEGGDGKIDQ